MSDELFSAVHPGNCIVGVNQQADEPLTAEQCRLVRENIGLVAVHLRRRVTDLATPRRDRERDDLFQEGCLGLIEAARRFRPERSILFPAFALPRIHNAVSKALRTKFSTIRVPSSRKADESVEARSMPASGGPRAPNVFSISDETARGLAAPLRRGSASAGGETVGERLRDKYEAAVEAAGRGVADATSTRGDRAELVRILTRERFLVPREEARRPLRQIARDTRSSYARVAQCDKQISEAIRRTLDDDPEFCELRRRARSNPSGCDAPIDDEVERALASASADEFMRRFRRADPQHRARVLHAVLEASQGDVEDLVRNRFARLPKRLQNQLLDDTSEPRDVARSRRRHHPGEKRTVGSRRGGCRRTT